MSKPQGTQVNKEEEKVNLEKSSPTKQAPKFEAFVKSLPFSSTVEEIQDFFKECGTVENVNLLKGRGGRSKGVAFVRFNNPESLQKAIAKNGVEFGGRTLVIEAAAPREERPQGEPREQRRTEGGNSNSVFVGNLSYTTTEESLRKIFAGAGEITAVRIAKDHDGRPRGFAHVDFVNVEGATEAVKKTGVEVDGRTIRVDFSSGQRSGGFRGGRGGRGGFGGRGSGRGFSRGGSRGGPRGGFRGGYSGERTEGGYRGERTEGGYRGERTEGGYRGERTEGGYRGERTEGGYRGERTEGGYRGERTEGGYRGGRTEGGYRGGRGGYRGDRNE